ncbi:hypothetical protein PIB30_028407 [Stylosanthes scabra]|uniref:GH18 domain-containing protein n=1 Tax=Stylosanthes scabra TaxID=79078 RepID=A0ABU6UAD8_9FABA|nr:hypothetical protein [Stylosanthes scabra]
MISNDSSRNSFIQSSIRVARIYGFQGLDLAWAPIRSSSDMYNTGMLFQELRAAAECEARNSTNPESPIFAWCGERREEIDVELSFERRSIVRFDESMSVIANQFGLT